MKKANIAICFLLGAALVLGSCGCGSDENKTASSDKSNGEAIANDSGKTGDVASSSSSLNDKAQIDTIVQIEDQIWMVNNLNVGHFRNGDQILEARSYQEWDKAGVDRVPAWTYYMRELANGKKYGKIYNWYAVSDSRGLAPQGWHIPSEEEWAKLRRNLGGAHLAGTKMKSESGWELDGNGDNKSGFNGLPSGARGSKGGFTKLGTHCYWWSSTEENTDEAMYLILGHDSENAGWDHYKKGTGMAVRCIKD